MKSVLMVFVMVLGFGGAVVAIAANGHFPLKKMLRDLDLSEQQQVQIDEIITERKQARKDNASDHKQHREAFQQQLQALLSADELDESALSELINTQVSFKIEHHLQRARTLFSIKALLTPQQQQQLNERLAEHRFAMGKRHRHGEMKSH